MNRSGKNTVLWQVLLYLSMTALLFAAAGIVVTATLGLYSHSTNDALGYQYQRITQQKCTRILEDYNFSLYGVDFYDLSADYRGVTNFRYSIYSLNDEGERTFLTGNYMDEPYITQAEYSDVFYTTSYIYAARTDEDHTEEVETSFDSDDESSSAPDVSSYDSDESSYVEDEPETIYGAYNAETWIAVGYYCPKDGVVDLYTITEKAIELCGIMLYVFPIIALVSIVVCVILTILLTKSLWRYAGEDHTLLSARLPTDFLCLVVFLVLLLAVWLIDTVGDAFHMSNPGVFSTGGLILLCLLLPFTVLLLYTAATVQLRQRRFWRTTLIGRILCGIFLPILRICVKICCRAGQFCRKLMLMIPLAWRTAIGVPLVLVFLCMMAAHIGNPTETILLLFLCIGIYLWMLYADYAFRILQKSGGELARGNLSYKTDTKNLLYIFRQHAEDLNAIGDGMEAAIAEKIKSEHFKTELITNVSHDIKTPLTSIINYTDLLSKEPLDGKAREYTEILSRQSARLKKLTEDLVEASKATTGNLPCNPERLSICQIVRQSLGEYEERLENAGLEIRDIIPEEELYAMVDGRLLWRVLENLYSNVCKYALTGTRVYLVVAEDDNGRICISMKNISRDALIINGEELTERFVKGDASRSSDGSGLGLNIAKSLVELQKGSFHVLCDGDLFRCDIIFPKAE